MLPKKFQVNWPFGSEEEAKNFQDGCHSGQIGFLIVTILAIFDLQVTQMLPTKFHLNWPFNSGEEAKNSHSNASYQFSSQLAQGVGGVGF